MSLSVAKSISSVNCGVGVFSLLNVLRNIKPQFRSQGSTFLKISCNEKLSRNIKPITHKFYCILPVSCWKCGSEVNKKDLFCRTCNVLQTADQNSNYFDILNVEERYELESKQLTTNYRNLQRVLHPDRFGNKGEDERRISADYSSLVNKAYTTLFHPLSRGIYILELKGVKVEEETAEMSPEFLMDIMERNEEIDDLKDKDKIIQLTKIYQDILLNLSRDVGEKFKQEDLVGAKEILRKMKYFANIESRLKLLRQKFGILD